MRHRFAPMGHGKVRLDFPCFLERFTSIVVLKAVEQQDTLQEAFLRCRRTRGGELDLS